MIEDIGVDVGAVFPGNGSAFHAHGTKNGRIPSDRIKDGAVQIGLQVNHSLGSIVKCDACSQVL